MGIRGDREAAQTARGAGGGNESTDKRVLCAEEFDSG